MAEPARSQDRTARSPAESFQAARLREAYQKLTDFCGVLSFELDPFQRQACQALEDGHGVLVCAPTGAGKTVVGEFAVHLALASGGKCFYTTPIKALSNQKFADLGERYGAASVGLLTGDTSVNANAPIVVMTTEVLRNMLYAGSSTLTGLEYVVMDEVHYLADRFRGAVWEEVILQLPEDVRVVSLSATVSNAEEFGEWLVTVRGDTSVVVDEHRPVPLWQHMVVGNQLLDLFGGKEGGTINPRLKRRADELTRRYPAGGPRRGPRDRGHGGGRYRKPNRVDVLNRLDADGLLPAIVFVFSRAGCDAAVNMCLRAGLRLTTNAEADEIRAVAERHTSGLPRDDLQVLGYWEWVTALEHGVAAHHAGMLPAFKEAVEELFVRGLIKAVFATETLALGINMPARTVVLERLVKYNGETHADLTPGEYTQLTGRAGRRGIDVEGHAVVLWEPGMDPKQVAGLASTRTYPLRSSFRPGYNMAVNLVGTLGAQQARELLEQSFAQFQADRSVVGLARKVERNRAALDGYAEGMRCEAGDFGEYFELRVKLNEREKLLARGERGARRAEALESLERLRKGDVIGVPGGRRAGLAVVVDPGTHPNREPRPTVITESRWGGQLSAAEFTEPVSSLGRVKLPKQVNWRSPQVRKDVAASLRNTGITAPGRNRKRTRAAGTDDQQLARLRQELRAHPCHDCPEREQHARWAERHRKLRNETKGLESKVAGTTHSLARSFDRIRALLVERGYLTEGEHGEQRVTEDGNRLARIYSESDLLAAECVRNEVWAGLEPDALAAVVSTLVFEARREAPVAARVPSGPVQQAVQATNEVWQELEADERRHKLERTREPDAGFAWPIYRWSRGESLEQVLSSAEANGQELSAGDFVRWCRQVIDILDQLDKVLGRDTAIGSAAHRAVRSIRRGVVELGT